MSIVLKNNTVASVTKHKGYNRVYFYGNNKVFKLASDVVITGNLLNALYSK